MMRLIFFLIIIAPGLSKAQNVLFQGPGASQVQFQIFLNNHKNYISYVDHIHSRLQNNQVQEESLFQLSEIVIQNPDLVLEELKKIQEKEALTLVSLRFIRDLSDKMLGEKLKPETQKEFQGIYCKSISILNEGPSLHSCRWQNAVLASLQKRYPQIERIEIESFAFSPQETAPLAERAPYQWTLLSNSHKALHFYGTFEQLLNQHFNFEEFVSGTCDNYSVGNLDFELQQTGNIFFSKDCVQKAQTPIKENSWMPSKKTILISAGVLGAIGLISIAKDKTLVIDTSSFH